MRSNDILDPVVDCSFVDRFQEYDLPFCLSESDRVMECYARTIAKLCVRSELSTYILWIQTMTPHAEPERGQILSCGTLEG